MNKNIVQIELEKIENSCFVVMPFNPLFQSEYENIIQPALDELNIRSVRGDEIYSEQRIMDDIWNSIRNCRFVLAEMTDKNPNVLYEVGLAHAIGKPVIIITRNADDVPFDLKALRYLFYDVNDPFWGENLKKGIQALAMKLLENPDIDKYLAGISRPDPINFPKITAIKKIQKKEEKIRDISGSWIGSFELNGYHSVTININQKGRNLDGTAVIDLRENKEEEHAIVQEIMAGTMYEEKAILKGVNYSFVKRGEVNNYILDSFVFKEFSDNLLVGIVTDSQDESVEGEIRLKRNVT